MGIESSTVTPSISASARRAPELRSQLVAQGAEVVTMTPVETGKFFVAEQARWAGVVKQAGIKLEA